MEDERFVFGAIIGFVGGLLILVFAAYELYLVLTFPFIPILAGFPVDNVSLVTDVAIIGIVLGILIMIVAVLLADFPEYHTFLGGLMIVLSVISVVSLYGGNGIGLLLGVVGGACGIAFGPEEPYYPPGGTHRLDSTAGPTVSGELHRGCSNCGKILSAESTVCPNCGAKS
jgi:hypothetical protein